MRRSIVAMSNPKKKKGGTKPVTFTSQEPPRTKQGRHLGIQMPTRLRPEVYAVVEALAEREDRSTAKMGEILVREALEARGLWPPPADASASS